MPIPPSSHSAKILTSKNRSRTNPFKPQPAADAGASTPKIPNIPERLRRLEPATPIEVRNDDPVFDTQDAAQILGLKEDRLIKWRARGQGPEFLRYEESGHVRYELSALIAFKAASRVRPSRQPNPGRRQQP